MPTGAPRGELPPGQGALTILNNENYKTNKNSSSDAAAVLHADDSSASLQGPAAGGEDADQAKCQDPASLTSEVDVTADRNTAERLHSAREPDGLEAPATSEKRTATSVERVKTFASSARSALGHGCPTVSSSRGHRILSRDSSQPSVSSQAQPCPVDGELPPLD